MKSVLISIQPKWCKLIASGEKTIEVRKTAPQMPLPFKCYIYCTKSRKPYESFGINNKPVECSGYVIGEFECKDVRNYCNNPYGRHKYFISDLKATCLTMEDLWSYGKRKELYGWHISDLVIYDKPKGLDKFIVKSDLGCCNEGKCRNCHFFDKGNGFNVEDDCTATFDTDEYKPLRRPPQSWCYVKELQDA